jgi:hypothetical protein
MLWSQLHFIKLNHQQVGDAKALYTGSVFIHMAPNGILPKQLYELRESYTIVITDKQILRRIYLEAPAQATILNLVPFLTHLHKSNSAKSE